MKHAGFALIVVIAALAALVIFFLLSDSTDAPEPEFPLSTPTADGAGATATPLPSTWLEALRPRPERSAASLIGCGDDDGDGLIASVQAAATIALIPGEACRDPESHADFLAEPATPACGDRGALLIVGVASAGSDLLDASAGESLGLLDIVNALRARAEELAIDDALMLSTAAVFGAEQPQTSMERWIAAQAAARLDAQPCLRAVFLGHSHGGATVTSATASLDDAYGDRMLAVLIDRTTALYDRPATEMPARTPMLNFFQTNEGWHGIALDLPNAVNFDESGERAPVAPSDGGGGFALVSHKTLDDSPGVQRRVVDAIATWLTGPPQVAVD